MQYGRPGSCTEARGGFSHGCTDRVFRGVGSKFRAQHLRVTSDLLVHGRVLLRRKRGRTWYIGHVARSENYRPEEGKKNEKRREEINLSASKRSPFNCNKAEVP